MTVLHGTPLGETKVPPKAMPTTGSGSPTAFLDDAGQLGELIRSFDWTATSLGGVQMWPQSLRTVVNIMLAWPQPILLFWGPELRLLYNDAFCGILGDKHPQALGARASEALHEAWDQLGPLVAGVLASGKALYVKDGRVIFERGPVGLKEEGYFTWSYVPVRDEANEICGIFTTAAESTTKVIGEQTSDGAELAVVRRNALRLYKTVNSLLDFSRLEAQAAAVVAPIDLCAHTAEVAGAFRSTIEGTGVRFNVDCARLPPVFHADPEMWEKVQSVLRQNNVNADKAARV